MYVKRLERSRSVRLWPAGIVLQLHEFNIVFRAKKPLWRQGDQKLRNKLPVAKKHGRSSASRCFALDAADGFQPGAGMDFRLRQHRGLGAEALNQRANKG